MSVLLNAQATVRSAPGTGAVPLGAGASYSAAQAALGSSTTSLSWAAGGAIDGAIYSYRIEGVAGWEIGIGTYSASGPSLSRTVILASSNGGAAVNFGPDAIVSQVLTPLDASPGINPQGRLTIQSGTPVMTTATSAATSIIYTPYRGNLGLVGNGLLIPPSYMTIGEVSQSLSDTTRSPAAAVANSAYDVFSWSLAGVGIISRGPAWSAGATPGSNIARGTGAGSTALVRVGGYLVNANAIVNGPAAGYGIYLGSFMTDSSGATISWSLGGSASNGTQAAILNVWNNFNRILFRPFSQDSTASWTYAGGNGFRSANGSNNNRITLFNGLAEESVEAMYTQLVAPPASFIATSSIGLDSTNTPASNVITGYSGNTNGTQYSDNVASWSGNLLGSHFLQAIENASSGATPTFYGAPYSGLRASMRA